MNRIKCESCKFGIPVDANERVLLCDNPDLKTYGKNVKHGRRFSCGYGVMWNSEVPKMSEPLPVPKVAIPQQVRIRVGLV